MIVSTFSTQQILSKHQGISQNGEHITSSNMSPASIHFFYALSPTQVCLPQPQKQNNRELRILFLISVCILSLDSL